VNLAANRSSFPLMRFSTSTLISCASSAGLTEFETKARSILRSPCPPRPSMALFFMKTYFTWQPPTLFTSPKISRSLTGTSAPHSTPPLVFLDINGWIVADPDERLYDAMLSIATGVLDKRGLAGLLKELAVPDADEP
jgi:hypothetical protein